MKRSFVLILLLTSMLSYAQRGDGSAPELTIAEQMMMSYGTDAVGTPKSNSYVAANSNTIAEQMMSSKTEVVNTKSNKKNSTETKSTIAEQIISSTTESSTTKRAKSKKRSTQTRSTIADQMASSAVSKQEFEDSVADVDTLSQEVAYDTIVINNKEDLERIKEQIRDHQLSVDTLLEQATKLQVNLHNDDGSEQILADFDEVQDDEGRIFWTSWKYNWFISTGLGYQTKIGNSLEGLTVKPGITYASSFGKWLFPFVGLRVQVSYTPLVGSCTFQNIFVDENNNFVDEAAICTIHGDIIFNMSNIIAGYKEGRPYQLMAYVGMGTAIAFGNGNSYSKDYPIYGIVNYFKLTESLSLKLEIRSSPANAGHYGVQDDNRQRYPIHVLSTTAGVTYNFQRFFGYKKQDPKVITKYVQVPSDPVVLREVEVVHDTVMVNQIVKELVLVGCVVRFELDSYHLSKISRVNLSYIAEAINKIDSDQVFNVVGYCDVHTGSVAYNEKLSKKRAQVVYDALVNEFGVDKKRLKIDHKGGVENMFYDDQRLSRVVIMQ